MFISFQDRPQSLHIPLLQFPTSPAARSTEKERGAQAAWLQSWCALCHPSQQPNSGQSLGAGSEVVEGGELAQTMGAATQLVTQVMGASGRKDFWEEVWESVS